MPVADGFLTRGFRVDRIQRERDLDEFFLHNIKMLLDQDLSKMFVKKFKYPGHLLSAP